jgi:biofilm PGA synthesis N-glycosyltransferase PgaC
MQPDVRMSGAATRYVIVSPVKDEERYVEHTLQSVVGQTLKPASWIIVDDGSRDSTPEIVRSYQRKHPFIRLVSSPTNGPRRPGSGVIHAFNLGYAALETSDYEFIVKLDCDLSFERDYFETLIGRFRRDERLGIASGVYSEVDQEGRAVLVKMPSYHAFGACKLLRRTCFEDIGGFVAARGWDTVDEIRAMSRGWKTTHFQDLETQHHKPEGSGIGALQTSRMHGEIFYATGGDPLFFVFKALQRLATQPYLIGGAALVAGYLGALLGRKPRLVTRAEARAYRTLLRQRLWSRDRRPAVLPLVQSGQ